MPVRHAHKWSKKMRSVKVLIFQSIRVAVIAAIATILAVAQPGTSIDETIPSGSLVIAMDNAKQGNSTGCNGPAFNLKAYGLAVRLLHNNIPVKWAIANKASKDANDFTVNATRISGQSCQTGPSDFGFSGGPLVVVQEYAVLALPIITAFNNEIDGTSNDVRVYQTNAAVNAPIRYTLTHKPLIAVGPVDGGWGGDPHTTLFTEAKLTGYFAPVEDIDIGPGSCYTMATQAHATSAPFYNSFRGFVENGGNFLIQCESITHYEQNQNPRFQTANGFNLFGNSSQFPGRTIGTSSTQVTYPNPAMPFSQFVGAFASNVDGAVSEFSVIGGDANFINNTLSAVRNTSTGWTTAHIAAVGRIPTSTGGGGHVFTIGGHDYYRDTTPTNASLERRNAQRMILNAVLVPSERSGCSLSIPIVKGFKQVEYLPNTPDDAVPVGVFNPGDTITWTIRYINDGLVPVTNFQIVDPLQSGLIYQGPLVVTTNGSGTIASANASYNGTGNNNMLASNAVLGIGGMITVKVRTTVTQWTTYLNHPTAYGTGMPEGGERTDTVDATTPGTFGGYPIGCQPGSNCYPQEDWQTPSLDPTGILLVGPTSAPASVEGRVIDAGGRALSRINVEIYNVQTGEIKAVTTGSFGTFKFDYLTTAQFYVVSVSGKRVHFPIDTHSFTLLDNVVGLTFVAGDPQQVKNLSEGTKAKVPARSGLKKN